MRERKTVRVGELEQALIKQAGVIADYNSLHEHDSGRAQASVDTVRVIITGLNSSLGLNLKDPFEKKGQ